MALAILVVVSGRTVQVKPQRQLSPPPRFDARTFEVVTIEFFKVASAQAGGVIANVGTYVEQAMATSM